ncbi:gamma-glutamylcyclotransferase [Thermodesulfobacteriota bacterium]
MLTMDLDMKHFTLVLRDESLPPRDYLGGLSNLFVCGALMDPGFVADLLGHPVAGAFAVALDYARGYEEVDGEKVHFMTPEKGGVLPGMVWLDLSDEDVRCFEAFEQVPRLRERVDLEVRVGDILLPAFTYMKKS